MSIFKCKMCGGNLRLEPEAGIAVCEYCGTRQTLPRSADGHGSALFERAGEYRRSNDFDKAAALYEQLLNQCSDDAELYWLLVLCRYGIEYVEDPTDHRRVPTVNRTQFVSILEDRDYHAALQYATPAQRRLYEAEAREIDRIQRSILAISQREEPFDVFICYKETDAQGRRTMDSVLAMELYKELTRDGVKTFFSRITLQDKLGVAYEPYIFAALHSARVMVVIGTRAEHFAAVWVKNEWNRYLALIRSGEKKVLIPAYRDMDPYLLPEEFRYLQAQDLSQVGAIQDLAFGVEKLLRTTRPAPTAEQEGAGAASSQPQSQSLAVGGLLERAFLFLEDGQWDSADEYCEKVLDVEPKNARAYVGKLLAQQRLHTVQELAGLPQPFEDDDLCRKAMRFGDAALQAELAGYNEAIRTRQERERLENLYAAVDEAAAAARTEEDFRAVAQRFAELGDYNDAAQRSAQCLEQAETARREEICRQGKELMEQNTVAALQQAVSALEPLRGWGNVDALLEECYRRIPEREAWEAAEKIRLKKRKARQLNGALALALALIAMFILKRTVLDLRPVKIELQHSANDVLVESVTATGTSRKNTVIIKLEYALLDQSSQVTMMTVNTQRDEKTITFPVDFSPNGATVEITIPLGRFLTAERVWLQVNVDDGQRECLQIQELDTVKRRIRTHRSAMGLETNVKLAEAASGDESVDTEKLLFNQLHLVEDMEPTVIGINGCSWSINGDEVTFWLDYVTFNKYGQGIYVTAQTKNPNKIERVQTMLLEKSFSIPLDMLRHADSLWFKFSTVDADGQETSDWLYLDDLTVFREKLEEVLRETPEASLEAGFVQSADLPLINYEEEKNIKLTMATFYVEGGDVVLNLRFERPAERMNYCAFSPPNGEIFGVRGELYTGDTRKYIRIPIKKFCESDELTLSVWDNRGNEEFRWLRNFEQVKAAVQQAIS